MAARQAPALHQVARLARVAGAIRGDPDHHGAHVALPAVASGAHLHRQVGDVGHPCHAGHGQNAAVAVIAQAGGFGIRSLGVFLHHPQVGAAVVQQHIGIVHHAAVDARHGEGHANQQPQAQAGEHELAPGVQDVAAGQADHGATPAICCTTVTRVLAVSALRL